MTIRKYISASQAAELARVDRRTIVNWCADGKFSCLKVGATWMINEKAFLEFLSARMAFE
jgi:excisionase family DNA binding protein